MPRRRAFSARSQLPRSGPNCTRLLRTEQLRLEVGPERLPPSQPSQSKIRPRDLPRQSCHGIDIRAGSRARYVPSSYKGTLFRRALSAVTVRICFWCGSWAEKVQQRNTFLRTLSAVTVHICFSCTSLVWVLGRTRPVKDTTEHFRMDSLSSDTTSALWCGSRAEPVPSKVERNTLVRALSAVTVHICFSCTSLVWVLGRTRPVKDTTEHFRAGPPSSDTTHLLSGVVVWIPGRTCPVEGTTEHFRAGPPSSDTTHLLSGVVWCGSRAEPVPSKVQRNTFVRALPAVTPHICFPVWCGSRAEPVPSKVQRNTLVRALPAVTPHICFLVWCGSRAEPVPSKVQRNTFVRALPAVTLHLLSCTSWCGSRAKPLPPRHCKIAKVQRTTFVRALSAVTLHLLSCTSWRESWAESVSSDHTTEHFQPRTHTKHPLV